MNAALALVSARGAPGQGDAVVHEAVDLEAAAEEELRAAREADREFQRQRKSVQDLAVTCWEQLTAVAKVRAVRP